MIEIEDITKTYRMGNVDVNAVNGISLSVKDGEMISIIGASGSGKSNLMNIIGCLDKPTSGSYRLDGTDIGNLNDNRLAELRNKKFGFVFQDYNLLSRASAMANVELPATTVVNLCIFSNARILTSNCHRSRPVCR